MNALRHSKRHHNTETETVVRLAVKLMRVAYGEFYDRFCAVIIMIVIVLCVELSIAFKLKSINIRESISIAPRIGQHNQSHCADQMRCNNYYS